MLTGELKQLAIGEVTRVVMEMQERRASITDETLKMFTTVRQFKKKDKPACENDVKGGHLIELWHTILQRLTKPFQTESKSRLKNPQKQSFISGRT